MISPAPRIVQRPHELQTLMEKWSNTAPPAMAEKLTSHVHDATTIFSCITTEARALVPNQEILLVALNEALARIHALKADGTNPQADHEQAMAPIQGLEEANPIANYDLTTLSAQAASDALKIKALAIHAQENSPTSNPSGGLMAKISDLKKFHGNPED